MSCGKGTPRLLIDQRASDIRREGCRFGTITTCAGRGQVRLSSAYCWRAWFGRNRVQVMKSRIEWSRSSMPVTFGAFAMCFPNTPVCRRWRTCQSRKPIQLKQAGVGGTASPTAWVFESIPIPDCVRLTKQPRSHFPPSSMQLCRIHLALLVTCAQFFLCSERQSELSGARGGT